MLVCLKKLFTGELLAQFFFNTHVVSFPISRYVLNTDVLGESIHFILMKMIQREYHCWQVTNAETEASE